MFYIKPNQVTPAIKSLFVAGDPAYLRCLTVLEGSLPGDILVDKPANPTWSAVRCAGGGTTFFSRTITSDVSHKVVNAFRQTGNVAIGLRENDPRWIHVPSDATLEGVNIEFSDRSLGQSLETCIQAKPLDCHIQPMNPIIFPRCAWYAVVCREYGTMDQFFQRGLGFCLMRSNEILAEVYLTPAT